MRDALNRSGRPIVFSIEPFSIHPDPEQGPRVANLWRVGCDIASNYDTILARADLSDKWAPLAGPGGWNDPDMINLHSGLSLGENRIYFALWAIMKAPLLLSSNLPQLDADLLALANNTELIAVNQDLLGVQARKLVVDGKPLPWLVSLASCYEAPRQFYARSRGMGAESRVDTKSWQVKRLASPASPAPVLLVNAATKRCLALSPGWKSKAPRSEGAVVLLPCREGDMSQHWVFDKGLHTVTSVTNVLAGLALAVPNSTLFAMPHGQDEFQVSDAAYGDSGLVLIAPYNQDDCKGRDCQNYDPSQMWYFSSTEGLLKHATYTASINHKADGDGYTLTRKVPTWRHHCLTHTLSVSNAGSSSGATEVWGGPLSGGDFVIALLNRGSENATMQAEFSDLTDAGAEVAPEATFSVRDLTLHRDLGKRSGAFSADVPARDIRVFKLSKSEAPHGSIVV
eukprot:TRINITY_DN50840_c0_g1_i1.p1 TRINITY_DN50840_c0_g1~~TRINITY_DN50840_c0_g1_i1.p1  ORF type:complete len:530 (+),score=97.52 TRINITY_DN50840_c0_g1_i1:227-1591(+)